MATNPISASSGQTSNFFLTLFHLSLDLAMIFGPSLAYIKQYLIIKRDGKVGSFSFDVCGILLFGQALRIFFWYRFT